MHTQLIVYSFYLQNNPFVEYQMECQRLNHPQVAQVNNTGNNNY